MNRSDGFDAEALLLGYSAGELTADEERSLFEAAAGLNVGSHLHEAARAAAELDPNAVPAAIAAAWGSEADASDAARMHAQSSMRPPKPNSAHARFTARLYT